tara:strand:+ start:16 stop:510 length:495 start_codon:yes stop_codon:yes gene_type:complete
MKSKRSREKNFRNKKNVKKSVHKKRKLFRHKPKKVMIYQDGGSIISEISLLRSTVLKTFIMLKDLVLRYYPDADVPNKNLLVQALIRMAETVQEIVCETAQTTQRIFCEEGIETPGNIKDLACKNMNTLRDLTCNNIKDSIRLIDNATSIHLSDTVVDILKTDD